MNDLTLWHIEADLSNLINLRDEMEELGEDLAPIDSQIAAYVQAQVRKVDSLRSFFKYAEMMVAAAEAEARLQKSRAQRWQVRIDRLKHACQCVMEAMPWKPDQVRRIDGKTGSLLLKTNGGKQEVVITQESLIPEGLVQYEGRISGELLRRVKSLFVSARWPSTLKEMMLGFERVPHKGRIAEALSQPCPKCKGVGAPWNNSSSVPCDACDGDKLNRVPGAHFAPRGSHVQIL